MTDAPNFLIVMPPVLLLPNAYVTTRLVFNRATTFDRVQLDTCSGSAFTKARSEDEDWPVGYWRHDDPAGQIPWRFVRVSTGTLNSAPIRVRRRDSFVLWLAPSPEGQDARLTAEVGMALELTFDPGPDFAVRVMIFGHSPDPR